MLHSALRPPLSLDRELRGREEPPLVRRLPDGAAARSAVGSSHRSVRPLNAALFKTHVLVWSNTSSLSLPSNYESMKNYHMVTMHSVLLVYLYNIRKLVRF